MQLTRDPAVCWKGKRQACPPSKAFLTLSSTNKESESIDLLRSTLGEERSCARRGKREGGLPPHNTASARAESLA